MKGRALQPNLHRSFIQAWRECPFGLHGGGAVRVLVVGANDYLVKPFAFGEHLARLRALIRRGPLERPPVLSVGDVALDPAAHTVTRAGRPVALSTREFALLEFLMRQPGQMVSRRRLL